MGNEKLVFEPTKTWLREHKVRPGGCFDEKCYCVFETFNKHGQGYCTGIKLNNEDDLDIVALCMSYYAENEEVVQPTRYLMHPNEGNMISIGLLLAVTEAWHLMPVYRKQLAEMSKERTRSMNKRKKGC